MDVVLKTHTQRERIQYEIWWKFGQIYIGTLYSMNHTGAKQSLATCKESARKLIKSCVDLNLHILHRLRLGCR
jgi:hypothetical protein